MFPSFRAFYAPRICSSHHQSLVPPSPHNCAKEQRKLCQSNSSCTLLSDLIFFTALFISFPVHNFQWLPNTTELKISFLVWHSRHILAPASLSGLIACNYFFTNEPLAILSHFLRPWFVCIVCLEHSDQKKKKKHMPMLFHQIFVC